MNPLPHPATIRLVIALNANDKENRLANQSNTERVSVVNNKIDTQDYSWALATWAIYNQKQLS